MSNKPIVSKPLSTEADTIALGETLAGSLKSGDVIALDGTLGAGKTTLARAAVRRLMGHEIDVPSPTFTLVQTYEGPFCEIWHVDLYRIEDPAELDALGLEDAFADAITFIEWPDRLGAALPRSALHVGLSSSDEAGRTVTIAGSSEWAERLTRAVS